MMSHGGQTVLDMSETSDSLSTSADTSVLDANVHGTMDAAASAMPRHCDDSTPFSSSTLDEPIRQTFMRDLRAVVVKFGAVCWPRGKATNQASLLRDWDLWGPLMLCVCLSVGLHASSDSASSPSSGPQFAEVFVLVWLGSAVVTVSSLLLGGVISFFQSVCVIGYCLLPSVLALVLCHLLLWLLILPSSVSSSSISLTPLLVRVLMATAGLLWSSLAASRFLADKHPADRRALGLYPVWLFFFLIGWMIVSQTADG